MGVSVNKTERDQYIQKAANWLRDHPTETEYVCHTGDMFIYAERHVSGSISVYNTKILTQGHTFSLTNNDFLE